MKQMVNEVYRPLFTENARYFILMGGRGAGRSTVASQLANALLVAPEYLRCAIMRYILGDIRNSIYREILDRAEENGIREKLVVNDGIMSIRYGENSINAVGFKKSSGDQKSKLKSLASYNMVIIEEADEIPEEDFMQLDDSLRTVKGDIKIILLLNPPPKSHWIIKRWFDLEKSEVNGFYIPNLRPDVKDAVFIRSDYHDNEKNIAPASIEQYENYQTTKPAHYWNMIRGLIPETVRGKIYNNWQIIEKIPHEARLERYGVDFGYSNDPTAIVAVYKYNGGIILEELLYRKGMLNKPIADFFQNLPYALIVADSASPKDIDELRTYGLTVIAARKGQGSVANGIGRVQSQRVSYTKSSQNIDAEYQEYSWITNKDGETINEPKPGKDHIMDAIRYAVVNMLPDEEPIKRQFSGQAVLDKLLEEEY